MPLAYDKNSSTSGERWGRFALAAAGDLAGHVTGIPVSVLVEAARKLGARILPKWLWQSTFLDDAGPWPSWYPLDFASRSCLTIPVRGKYYRLPYVLVLGHAEGRIRVERTAQSFRLREDVAAFTEEALLLQLRRRRWLRKRISDDPNLRIASVRESPKTLVLEEVPYFAAVRTNLSLDYRPKGRQQSLRELLGTGGQLPLFRASSLADHIGVNTLLFTADRRLIVSRRSLRTALRQGELAPSSSGAVSIHDTKRGFGTLDAMEWFRESIEERGVKQGDVISYRFLGLARELIRGGKPELFFVATTTLSQADLRKRWAGARDKWEWFGRPLLIPFTIDPVEPLNATTTWPSFLVDLDAFLVRHQRRISWPLFAALALWTRFLAPAA